MFDTNVLNPAVALDATAQSFLARLEASDQPATLALLTLDN